MDGRDGDGDAVGVAWLHGRGAVGSEAGRKALHKVEEEIEQGDEELRGGDQTAPEEQTHVPPEVTCKGDIVVVLVEVVVVVVVVGG